MKVLCEQRRTEIKSLLDDSFKEITNNWWSVIRNEIHTYEEFKQIFRSKYWSESMQNIVRDNLCNGRYNTTHYQSLTAYFLGKVCVARKLEPSIPEECLVNKIAHHFDEGIVQATPVSYTHLDVYKRQT